MIASLNALTKSIDISAQQGDPGPALVLWLSVLITCLTAGASISGHLAKRPDTPAKVRMIATTIAASTFIPALFGIWLYMKTP